MLRISPVSAQVQEPSGSGGKDVCCKTGQAVGGRAWGTTTCGGQSPLEGPAWASFTLCAPPLAPATAAEQAHSLGSAVDSWEGLTQASLLGAGPREMLGLGENQGAAERVPTG